MPVTALTPKIGCDEASEIAKKADRERFTLKAAVLALGYLLEEEFDAIVVPSERHGVPAGQRIAGVSEEPQGAAAEHSEDVPR